MDINLIGIDIAKNVFQLCGVSRQGKVILEKRLVRNKLIIFLAQTPPCRIVMEACSSANYWSREFIKLGHQVELIAPQYVKPFVKGNKNDYRDAQAITEAASRPEMRYVTPKTPEQQDWQSLLRTREGYITMRTKVSNQIRGLLAEYGHVIPTGIPRLKQMLPTLFDPLADNGLSALMKGVLETQYTTLLLFDQRIEELSALKISDPFLLKKTDPGNAQRLFVGLTTRDGIRVTVEVAVK